MSNVLNFPSCPAVELIDEDYFEKFADAALLMMCFETIANAVEVVEEGVKISERDETHVSLLEACMALSVLFRRRTGHAVQHVSADHLQQQRQALLAGEVIASLPIPIRPPAFNPLPVTAFAGLDRLEVAQAAFNYVRRVSDGLKSNCPQLFELDHARTHSVDALNALSVLISRLSGGPPTAPPEKLVSESKITALQDKLVSEGRINAPTSETPQ